MINETEATTRTASEMNYNTITCHDDVGDDEGSSAAANETETFGDSSSSSSNSSSKTTSSRTTSSSVKKLLMVTMGAAGLYCSGGYFVMLTSSLTSSLSSLLSSTSSSSSSLTTSESKGFEIEVQGVDCCNAGSHVGNGKVPGDDSVNCVFGETKMYEGSIGNGNHPAADSYCRSSEKYAASHPNDPCGWAGIDEEFVQAHFIFLPGERFCCPKSNSDHHVAHIFGGCVKREEENNIVDTDNDNDDGESHPFMIDAC